MCTCCALNRSKRSYLSSVMSKEPSFVNVGAYHYALRAFPGVTEAGANVGAFACLIWTCTLVQRRVLSCRFSPYCQEWCIYCERLIDRGNHAIHLMYLRVWPPPTATLLSKCILYQCRASKGGCDGGTGRSRSCGSGGDRSNVAAYGLRKHLSTSATRAPCASGHGCTDSHFSAPASWHHIVDGATATASRYEPGMIPAGLWRSVFGEPLCTFCVHER
jgi:hypothetical protein